MTLQQLTLRVRRYVNDENSNIFSKALIEDFINEGINRLQSRMYFADMVELSALDDVPIILPASHHHLLAIYGGARCHEHDERHYQAGQRMNEFESKLDELIGNIEIGEIVLKDENGDVITFDYEQDYVNLVYADTASSEVTDLDEGVGGL